MKISKWIILLNLFLVMGYFVYSVLGKEKLIKEGTLVLLELAPVDPRSLMQGDYMQLSYKIAREFNHDSIPKRGYFVVKQDTNSVAQPIRIQSGREPLASGEFLIEYTAPRIWDMNIGAESYFFQEGNAARYDSARYGGVLIDKNGNSLLVGLYDINKQIISD